MTQQKLFEQEARAILRHIHPTVAPHTADVQWLANGLRAISKKVAKLSAERAQRKWDREAYDEHTRRNEAAAVYNRKRR